VSASTASSGLANVTAWLSTFGAGKEATLGVHPENEKIKRIIEEAFKSVFGIIAYLVIKIEY
jgi:hypothetical protein